MSSDIKKKKKHRRKKKGHWTLFLILVVITVVILTTFIRVITRDVSIKLRGDEVVTVEVGSHYDELGAAAEYGHKGFSLMRKQPLAVSISGRVDTNTIGEYKITYTAIYGKQERSVTRTVKVADTKAPEITLLTKEDYYTPIGGEYEEEGYQAIDAYDGDLTEQVVREELGDGTVRYTVKDSTGNEATVTRTIPYDDRTAPVITLQGSTEMVIDYDGSFIEPGFSATDDVDGDITTKVVVTNEPGESADQLRYIYTVTDAHGNTAKAERSVLRMDPEVPTILLEGDDTVKLVGGIWYKDPGYTAKDRKDGDITDKVTVEGEVEYWKPGTYTLKYSVKDADGNTATETRTVVVEGREQPEPIDMGDHAIYLTFDDGPSSYTQGLLDVLAKYDVKATFFVTANHKECDDMILAEYAAGHTVAIHTYTHDYSKVYKSEKGYFDDLNKMADRIEKLIGIRPTTIRFPGGSSNTVSRKYCDGVMTALTHDMDVMGFQYYDWNVLSGDANAVTITTEEVYKNVINGIAYNTKKGKSSIVLQHDVKKFSIDAVEDIIKWGLANGYTFYPILPTTPTVHQKVAN